MVVSTFIGSIENVRRQRTCISDDEASGEGKREGGGDEKGIEVWEPVNYQLFLIRPMLKGKSGERGERLTHIKSFARKR